MYAGKYMHVGDGTWNSEKDDFLLPNIQALNFQMMRYNGELTCQGRKAY